ncbi:MAG TPA: alanine/glycine:cation symporter family protein [Vicinamibacterales bacterium]|nr:alanine/glycine:cation symporter family protein [Vicinamibacterales bacterium]
MQERIAAWNGWVNGYVWGWPMIVLLLGTGLILTLLTGGVQFRYLGRAIAEVFGHIGKRDAAEGSISPFQAVATALASTVGVGNIAGVATAIALGGPGAVFWLWVSGVLGMCTKYAEIVIALQYRERDAAGVMRGGAMYTLKKGLGLPWLGTAFAVLVAMAAFGIGNMVQANTVAASLQSSFGVEPWVTGVVLVVMTAAVILGGVRRIGQVAGVMVPVMALIYVAGGLFVLVRYVGEIPSALAQIFDGAFTGTAATGGFAGATMMHALRYGTARGLFSNEAGLGSAPIAHAAARTDHPARQGLYGIFEVFVDTILVCSMTGLTIVVTGVWRDGETGAVLAGQAFGAGLPGTAGHLVVTVSLCLFAYSTLVGWNYYGETGVVYLFGARTPVPYRVLWLIFIYLGAIGSLQLVWNIADTLNGLMALPNLVALLGLIPLLRRLTREFFAQRAV